jgi:hypothetical protein
MPLSSLDFIQIGLFDHTGTKAETFASRKSEASGKFDEGESGEGEECGDGLENETGIGRGIDSSPTEGFEPADSRHADYSS